MFPSEFWVFVTEMTCVYCAVRAERLYNIQVSLHVEDVVPVEGPASSQFCDTVYRKIELKLSGV